MKIVRADLSHIDALGELFDKYRQFYGQHTDLTTAKRFIRDRLWNEESVIFMVWDESNKPAGFAQLYPTYSSVSMRKVWIVNDVFIDPDFRSSGYAKALLDAVSHYGKQTEALALKLAISADNDPGKSLYESAGFTRITQFDHYTHRLDD
ncbi:GNAT family N-acetyltransferase [Echinimonas agarilytica]|uniref:GNAT family N-acetyltransferase n=1 Tax=Echinimonas agarilytica TaxID=1215918 RepID=A0AA41W8X9_9GAMM|nr:GNAT family N-acetyltransferase [Echinimonas agarilytica]MCM2680511.1 GNAT family N-acetyltransferase [Echinimonas agarilytica]